MKIRAAVQAAKDSGICILARTDCRPTQGIDEAVARIEMYVQEGADILFLDSPADDDEIRRAVAAAGGKPSFAVLSPGANRACPSQTEAAALGFKLGTYPTAMLSPSTAGIKAGLEMPYSCKGGVCSTCRALVVEGEVDMDINFALEDYEVARGFVLCCQSYPVTDRLTLDFDREHAHS